MKEDRSREGGGRDSGNRKVREAEGEDMAEKERANEWGDAKRSWDSSRRLPSPSGQVYSVEEVGEEQHEEA